MSWVFDPITSTCEECGKSFKRIYNMRLHQRKLCHDGLTEANCPVCLEDLGGSRRRHNRRRHLVPCSVESCRKRIVFWDVQHYRVKHRSTEPLTTRPSLYAGGLRYATNLQDFVNTTLQPDQTFKDSIGRAVDSLYTALTRPSQIFGTTGAHTIKEIIKGGSLAKGTALNKNSDIDLVLFFNGYRTYGEFIPAIPDILDEIKTFIGNNPHLAEFHGETRHSIEVKVTSGLTKLKVDLLPAIDILSLLGSPRRVYQEMRNSTPSDRQYYSAALAPKLQNEFVKDAVSRGQPLLQNIIQIVKNWRKDYFDDATASHARLPTSFFFELVTIHCWEKAGKPASFDLNVALRSVMERLHKYNTLEIVWEKNYRKGDCGKLTKCAPYVMDPANPTNNLMERYNAWETVSKRAEELIMSPVLYDVPYQKRSWRKH